MPTLESSTKTIEENLSITANLASMELFWTLYFFSKESLMFLVVQRNDSKDPLNQISEMNFKVTLLYQGRYA
jgi:hypothetical protein